MTSLNAYFKPEILNRMDDIVLFKPLSIDDMSMIVDKILTIKYKITRTTISIEFLMMLKLGWVKRLMNLNTVQDH